jgi:hypothetical protein
MFKFKIEYETANPINGYQSERLIKIIESESIYNAVATLGQKINKDYCIDVYSVEEVK